MRKKTLRIGTIAILLQGAIWAQDITGRWQGTLQQGSEKFRLILKVDKAADAGWVGTLYSPDQFHDWGLSVPVSSVALQGKDLRFAAADLAGSYQGKISSDGNSLQGNWTQGQTLSLEFERATSATEWKDPTTHTVQFVTVENNVKLEVLDWGGAGPPLVFLAGGGATAHELDDFAPKFIFQSHCDRGISLPLLFQNGIEYGDENNSMEYRFCLGRCRRLTREHCGKNQSLRRRLRRVQ